MSLIILFLDELRGYAKSKVMIALWLGLPILAFLIQFFNPAMLEGLPVSFLVSLVVSSIGGNLSSIMLSTTIVNEKNRHVYELFLVRPVRRSSIILSKYLAVYLCLVIAVSISLTVGLVIDSITNDLAEHFLKTTFESLIIGISAMSITCSMGIFFGVVVSSVPVAVILSLYLGSQLSSIIILPAFFIHVLDPVLTALSLGCIGTCVVLTLNIVIFNRKQF